MMADAPNPKTRRFRLDWAAIAALFLALPLMVPFLAPGLPDTADGEIHLHRILSAAVNLDAGYLWPRWTPYLHQGYGYPIHNFYAPGLHIVGGALYLLTHLDPVIILKLLMFAAALLYPLGAYRFARTFTGRPGALAAAAAYTYTPFRFHELWVQTNLSQFWAMALLPWLFWAIAKAAEQPRRNRVAVIGLLFAAIILLHHPTGFLVAPFAGLYVLWMAGRDWRKIVGLGLGLALGLLLSAVFWVPALAELQLTQISRVQEGAFDVVANLIDLPQLIRLVAPVDRSLLNTPEFYSAGLPQVAAALLGLLALLRAKTPSPLRRNLIFGGLGLLLALWLITPASGWVWLHLPIARLVIYPWRLLGIAALMGLPGAAAIPGLVPQRWRGVLAGGVIAVFFAAALPMLYAPLHFYEVPPTTPETTLRYEQRTGNVGLTSADEYLPAAVVKRPLSVKATDFAAFEWRVDLETPPDGVTAERIACAKGATCYTVESPSGFTLVFHQLDFPGLQVTLDGTAAATFASGESALLSTAIPAGSHTVAVSYAGTTIQHASEAVSLLALAAAVVLLVTAPRTPPRRTEPEPAANRLALGVIGVMLGFVLLDGLYLTPHTSIFRPASNPSEPPAQHSVSVSFGSLELVGYDLFPETARPGDTIRVRLYWHALQPLDSVPRGAVHVTARDGRADWGGTAGLALGAMPPERWATNGYVTDDYRFTLDPSAPPFVGELRVTLFGANSVRADDSRTEDASRTEPVGELRVLGDLKTFPDDTLTLGGAAFGDQIALAGAGLRAQDGQTCLDLRWAARRGDLPEYTVMLHLLDAAGNAVAFADAPPLDGLYPTSRWLAGQTLDDPHCFTRGDAVAVQLGLYTPADGTRLPVTDAGSYTVLDNSLQIPLPAP